MKNETARREIESLDYYLQNHTDDYSEESHTAMMMAVKALEQEPKTNSWSIKDVVDTFKKHGLIREQEPREDAISRQAAIDALTKTSGIRGDALKALYDLPSVTPAEKVGHWIFDEILDKHYYCSECKSMGVDYWDFCPYCGAKMIEPQESEEV